MSHRDCSCDPTDTEDVSTDVITSSCVTSSRIDTRCDSRDTNCDSFDSHCESGESYLNRPEGVWNIVLQYDNSDNGTTVEDQPIQLLLNPGGTLVITSSDDYTNNPFPVLLTTVTGVWKKCGDRHIRLEGAAIGYNPGDGSPKYYYKIRMSLKLNHRGTKTRLDGSARAYELCDPSMCTPACNIDPVCFYGCGYKILNVC